MRGWIARIFGFETSVVLALASAGCVAHVAPRFPAEVSAGIAAQPMVALETEELTVYHASNDEAAARAFAEGVGACLHTLRLHARIESHMARRKPLVILPGPAFNNGFVLPPESGGATTSVVSSYSNDETLLAIGAPPDPINVGCHEMVHWTHEMQVGGFWSFIDIFGDLMTPQRGLDDWFHEGLAVVYESALRPGSGRMTSPYWEGAFHAAFAGRRVNGGDLSSAQRTFDLGNHYLVGSRFLQFLRDRYGEEKLWQLVEKQGHSIFYGLWVSLRFWQIYDKNLSTLLDEFADDVAARYPVRERSHEQRMIRAAGTSARYAVARNGTEATIRSELDDPVRIEVNAPDGRLVRRKRLSELTLPRQLVAPSVNGVSGLSLTADGRYAYFVLTDRGSTFLRSPLVRYDIANDQLSVVVPDLGGPGGAVSDDGSAYFYSAAAATHHDVAELDLTTRARRVLVTAPAGTYFGAPRPSPDGRQLVVTMSTGGKTQLATFDRKGARALTGLVPWPEATVDPWFLDDRHVIFSGDDQHRYQVFVHDLETGRTTKVSQAPYLAMSARPLSAGRVRFLNRDGWGWTVDEVSIPAEVLSPPPVRETAEAPEEVPPSDDAVDATAAAPEAPTSAPALESPGATPAAPTPTAVAPARELPPRVEPPRSLFVPQVTWLSLATVGENLNQLLAGLSLSGSDPLEQHRWAVTGLANINGPHTYPSGLAEYVNAQLAPVLLSLNGSHLTFPDQQRTSTIDDPFNVTHVLRGFGLNASLPFYTHVASLGVALTEEKRRGEPSPPVRRLLGSIVGRLALQTAELTPYTAYHRLVRLELQTGIYPKAFSDQPSTFEDLRAALHLVVPVPPFRRLGFITTLTTRGLPGTREGAHFLELGGDANLLGNLYMYRSGHGADEPTRSLSPLPVFFAEELRGYDDYPILVDKVAKLDLGLWYPLIVDRGFASSLVLLPSFFISQLELEAFYTAASDLRSLRDDSLHAAAGSALALRFLVGEAPFTLRYQIAKRVRDDKALVHTVTFGF